MKTEDLEFLEDIVDKTGWFFYGEFENYLNNFLKQVFTRELKDYGFEELGLSNEFMTAYWQLLSSMSRLRLADYGTSPRGAWLTETGERFKKLILENENALQSVEEYIYKKYNI